VFLSLDIFEKKKTYKTPLLLANVLADNESVVSLEGLERQLLLGLDVLLLELGDLASKDSGGIDG